MGIPGIIYNTAKQLQELYDLPIKVYSYNSDFNSLWGFAEKNIKPKASNEIWCVVDEGDLPPSFVPIIIRVSQLLFPLQAL